MNTTRDQNYLPAQYYCPVEQVRKTAEEAHKCPTGLGGFCCINKNSSFNPCLVLSGSNNENADPLAKERQGWVMLNSPENFNLYEGRS